MVIDPYHQHRWSKWGPFEPVYPHLKDGSFQPLAPDDAPEPLVAYRWRVCECGAGERETWHDHSREIFWPGDKR